MEQAIGKKSEYHKFLALAKAKTIPEIRSVLTTLVNVDKAEAVEQNRTVTTRVTEVTQTKYFDRNRGRFTGTGYDKLQSYRDRRSSIDRYGNYPKRYRGSYRCACVVG